MTQIRGIISWHSSAGQRKGNERHISNRVLKAVETWAVSLIRYGAGTIKWNEEELQEIGSLEKS